MQILDGEECKLMREGAAYESGEGVRRRDINKVGDGSVGKKEKKKILQRWFVFLPLFETALMCL